MSLGTWYVVIPNTRYAAGEFDLDWISHKRSDLLKNQGLLVAEGEPIFVSPGEDWSELSK